MNKYCFGIWNVVIKVLWMDVVCLCESFRLYLWVFFVLVWLIMKNVWFCKYGVCSVFVINLIVL